MDIGPLARWYRWLEYVAFGRALERSRFVHIDRLRQARHVLVLGEGDGRMLRRMLDAAPQARFDVVEASAEMVTLASARLAPADGRVRFTCADARSALFDADYDAVVTCFFLDCLDEAEAHHLIGRVSRALVSGGTWLVAEFAVPASGWRRLHARLWIGTMYYFFGLTTGLRTRALPPIDALLSASGLRLEASSAARWGLIESCVWRRPAMPQWHTGSDADGAPEEIL